LIPVCVNLSFYFSGIRSTTAELDGMFR
jgi:hypothetical protein